MRMFALHVHQSYILPLNPRFELKNDSKKGIQILKANK